MFTLQFGQCGNQMGKALFSTISSDMECANTGVGREANLRYSQETFERWFGSRAEAGAGEKNVARAILLDSERKVLEEMCKRKEDARWTYQPERAMLYRREDAGDGTANNFALGYSLGSERSERSLLDLVARQLEGLDRSEGFVFLLSCGGGTGSGLGSHALELLREEYPRKPFLAVLALPYTFGDVATQHYNALLSLAIFNDLADAIFLMENEKLHRAYAGPLTAPSQSQPEDLSLRHLNRVIAEKLAGLLQPVEQPPRQNLNSLLAAITPHPSYKFPLIVDSPALEKDLLRPRRTCKPLRSSVANLLISRGSSSEAGHSHSPAQLLRALRQNERLARWSTSTTLHQPRRINNRDEYRALVSNHWQIAAPLEAILKKAWEAYVHAAFLHRYLQFGLENDDFLRSFAKIENVVQSYGQLNV